MQLIRGKIRGPQKVVAYGAEGIGKSTFAARFPDPVFIDTEGSTKELDVVRTPAPSSWIMLLEQVKYFINNPDEFKTLIIDTADWAERMCIDHICATVLHDKGKQITGIEDYGYGKGYTYVMEEFGRLLNLLTEMVDKGMNVVLTAHAKPRKFELPEEMGSYDRWEMKLSKQVASMVKEWADMVLFANYKITVTNVDGQGAQKGKNKAQGGQRIMYTSHHTSWDAKNRHDLPEELPFNYSNIAHIFAREAEQVKKSEPQNTANTAGQNSNVDELTREEHLKKEKELTVPPSAEISKEEQKEAPATSPSAKPDKPAGIPKALWDLMKENNVDAWTLETVVSQRGYYPKGTPITNYDPDFINGVLVGAWPQVYKMIQDLGKEIPFN